MLTGFDWLRRSRNGQELLATLIALAEKPALFATAGEIGPPPAALQSPCARCWIHPQVGGTRSCRLCGEILERSRGLSGLARAAVVIWGRVNRVPQTLRPGAQVPPPHLLGTYIHDAHHVLLMLQRREVKPWLQELVLHDGPDLQGVLQIFPTMGPQRGLGMGDVLCWAVHDAASLPRDRLYVRFAWAPWQVPPPHQRDQQQGRTFEVSEFVGLLQMAEVFRLLLHPHEQQELLALLTRDDGDGAAFYWGRFLGLLDPRARDMLVAWGIRTWPQTRIRLLDELRKYVDVDVSRAH
jgi:hypothetical protein